MLGARNGQRGDTLIEVLFAITVFSLLIIGALSIMSRGTAAAQQSLEVNLVRQQIDAQTETLRYMHDAYIASYGTSISPSSPAGRWAALMANETLVTTTPASDFSIKGTNDCPTGPANRKFIMSPDAARVVTGPSSVFVKADSFAQVTGQSVGTIKAQGMWIEAVKGGQDGKIGYVDFHIRACWTNSGAPVPLTTGTIVRLYDIRP